MKRGKEAKTTEGLHKVRPVWEHELEHVRHTMKRSGYTFAIVQHPASYRLYYLYTNLRLTQRLRARLYRKPGPHHPAFQRYYRECKV